MKIGQKLGVYVEGVLITEAVVTDLTNETVTIVIPGTEAVVGVKHSLTEEVPEREVEVDRVLLDDVEKPEPPIRVRSSETSGIHGKKLDSSILDD